MSPFFTESDNFALIPALLMTLFGCAALLFDFLFFDSPFRQKLRPAIVIVAEAFIGVAIFRQQSFLASSGLPNLTALSGAVSIDGFSIFFNWIIVIATLVVALVSYKYLDYTGENHTEYYGLLLFAQCGMFFLVTGIDLVTLFIGLELMALSFYFLVGLLRTEKRSN